MNEWLSVTQLSKQLEIPETTVRRYLNNFDEYFRAEQIGRGKKYHPDAIEILQRIAMLYSIDRETIEIKSILANEYAFSTEENGQNEATTVPPYNISRQFDEFQQKQEEFNRQLLQQLHEQQEYIKQLIDSRDQDIQEAKRFVSPEKERSDRFERIMLEHKVRKKLEEEAEDLWLEKPEEERMKKISWFRREEDKDQRYLFIKRYVNEHFEEYLRNEMGY